MISRSSIVDLNLQIAKNAAVINQKMRKIKRHWGLADSIIYATAKLYEAKVVTGDEHFRNLPITVFIKRDNKKEC